METGLKVLATKSKDLSSIPNVHNVEGENQFLYVALALPMCTVYMYLHTFTQ